MQESAANDHSAGAGPPAPEFEDLPGSLAAEPSQLAEHHETGYWVLSLFAPSQTDRVDWGRGSYNLVRRSGRTQDRGTLKVESAMVEEGSVLMAESLPSGLIRDIATDGADHAVYRAGTARRGARAQCGCRVSMSWNVRLRPRLQREPRQSRRAGTGVPKWLLKRTL
jgi:hypothetical protein